MDHHLLWKPGITEFFKTNSQKYMPAAGLFQESNTAGQYGQLRRGQRANDLLQIHNGCIGTSIGTSAESAQFSTQAVFDHLFSPSLPVPSHHNRSA
jgi:hypothetical protein